MIDILSRYSMWRSIGSLYCALILRSRVPFVRWAVSIVRWALHRGELVLVIVVGVLIADFYILVVFIIVVCIVGKSSYPILHHTKVRRVPLAATRSCFSLSLGHDVAAGQARTCQ